MCVIPELRTPLTQEVGGLQIQGQPELHSETVSQKIQPDAVYLFIYLFLRYWGLNSGSIP
jgi:hypothetical protein